MCSFCQDVALDPLGHHAVTSRHGGDVVVQHSHLRDVFVDFYQRAHLVECECGEQSWSNEKSDVRIARWDRGKPATF